MDFYPLFVFEADNLPSPISRVDDAVAVVKRLRKEEDESAALSANLRFVRLGKRLAQELPDEEKNFWLCRPDAALQKCRKIWQPEFRSTERIKKLLKVLLLLAKELHFGIFDARFGIYIPPEAQEMPMPNQAGMKYRFEIDSATVEPLSEKGAREIFWVSGTISANHKDVP